MSLGLLGRDHGSFGARIAAPSEPERQHEHGSRRAGQPVSPRKAWASRGTPFSRVTHLASGTHRSWRSWETRGAFGAGWPLQEHAWLDDGRFSLLTFLAPWSDPFVDGVLVGGHARPDLRRGDGGVVVRVVVVLVQVPDGFFCELSLQVVHPLLRRRIRVRGIGGEDRAGGNFGPGALVGGPVGALVGALDAFAVAEVLVRGWGVVVLAGHVLVVPDAGVLLLPGPLAGVGHRRGFRGGLGQLLGHLCGLSSCFHWCLGGGGLLAHVVRVLIVGVLVVIGVSFTLSFRVIFIGIGVLRLGLVGDRSVTVRAVVLAVVVSCPVVRDEEQLLDVSLKHLLIQNSGAKHDDAVNVYHGVIAAVQGCRHLLLTVQDQGDILPVDAKSNSVPLAI